jgi:hypothetical protein
MRHSLFLLLGFSAVAAAFTVSRAQHQSRRPERRSGSRANRDFNAIRRDPNRFKNPQAASELRRFKSIHLFAHCLRRRIPREWIGITVGGLRCRGQLGRIATYQFEPD